MKYRVMYKVLIDYDVEADSCDEAIDKANELCFTDERIKDFYAEAYCVDYYDENGELCDGCYLY